MIEVVMPEMGESVAEGTITRWLVKVGDAVEKDQPLVEVSTDKVDAEIPSPVAGTLREIRFEEGAVVEVDAVLAVIATDGAAVTTPATATGAAAVAGEATTRAKAQGVAAAARSGAEADTDDTAPAVGPARTLATPVARSIAKAEGIDLSTVAGSGAQGRVTKDDVLRAVAAQREAAPADAARATAASPPAPGGPAVAGAFHVRAFVEGERVELEPMSRIRRLTARHLSYSRDTSVHVTTVFHVDMTRVVETRDRVKAAFEREHGTKLTFMPFIFRALTAALRAHPHFNASIDGETIVYKKDINLGMAVAIDRGLIVPVIRDADRASLAGLALRANDLAERARAKKLLPDEIQRGTFTVTNPGVFGSLFGTPIINQPQVAILCVGAIEKRPVVLTDPDGRDAIGIRHMAYFALTYDHRLIDGADAERFMLDVKRTLQTESWSELLGLQAARPG